MFPTTSINLITTIEEKSIPWRCDKCNSILGYVVTENKIPKLDMVQQRGVKIIGDADIHCDDCGAIRTWKEEKVPKQG